jgi:hypothetical protein
MKNMNSTASKATNFLRVTKANEKQSTKPTIIANSVGEEPFETPDPATSHRESKTKSRAQRQQPLPTLWAMRPEKRQSSRYFSSGGDASTSHSALHMSGQPQIQIKSARNLPRSHPGEPRRPEACQCSPASDINLHMIGQPQNKVSKKLTRLSFF